MKYRLFSLPIYSPRLFVVVGKTTGQELYDLIFKKFGVKMPKLKKEVAGADGCCNRKDDLIVMWLHGIRGNAAIDTLCHESAHAAMETLRFSGMRYVNSANEEAFAYLIGHVVQTTLNWWRRK